MKTSAAESQTERPDFVSASLAAVMLGGMLWYMDSAVWVGWVGPLVTVLPLVFLSRSWVERPIALGLSVYGLSILSGIFAMELMGLSNLQSAELAGWVFPPCYSFIWLSLHGLIVGFGRPGPLAVWLGQTFRHASAVASALGGAALGAFVGAFSGGVSYFVCDEVMILELFLGYEYALTAWVSLCTLCGIGIGGREGYKLAMAKPQVGDKTSTDRQTTQQER